MSAPLGPRPTGPDPGVPERASRPDPVVREKMGGMVHPWLFILFVIVMIAFLTILVFSKPHPPDKRVNQRHGNLECVYNVDEDKIESCVAVYGG